MRCAQSKRVATLIDMLSSVSMKFDDELASLYYLALPERDGCGVSGTVFVISGLVRERLFGQPVMNKKMVVELSSTDWEIGSHTRTHPEIGWLSTQQLHEEMT